MALTYFVKYVDPSRPAELTQFCVGSILEDMNNTTA
jgi:hypothetical protein